MAKEGTFIHYTGEEALAYRAFQLEQDEWWETYDAIRKAIERPDVLQMLDDPEAIKGALVQLEARHNSTPASAGSFPSWPTSSPTCSGRSSCRRRNGWMSGGCRRRSGSPAGAAIARTAGPSRRSSASPRGGAGEGTVAAPLSCLLSRGDRVDGQAGDHRKARNTAACAVVFAVWWRPSESV
jgi:hypothetical protein